MTRKSLTAAKAEPVTSTATRRKFLKAATSAAAGGAALAAPMIAKSQTPIVWRFQSTWPAKDIFHEYAQDYARRVNEMGGGRLRLDVLPAGAVVGAFGMQDAVSSGVLDGGHGVCAYWYGKNKAFSLFGTAPAFGWSANDLLGWFYYGDGEKLYNELLNDILKVNVVGWLTGPMPTQPLGWFKKPITDAAQMQKLKYRTVGLAADLMNEMGAAVTIMGGADIVPAMDRGVLDAAEFNNPSSDLALGFPDVSKVYMLQSFHQDMECFEIIFNKAKYNALPKELQAIVKYAVEAASADMSWKLQKRYPEDLAKIEKQGVKVYETPKSVLNAQLAAWDKILARLSQENKFFGRVVESQKAWAKTIVGWRALNESPRELAASHFLGLKRTT
ncbi:MAG: TRAP transporter substrate-binding protein [Betaproteobacteria bacterium]|nr:MAG: TRAP transporter substrate-binding protein [Betaproteobacteria bacterium]